MIFCTAGHVDHGKTALVRALTGVDTDRLAEERRRGLTIELGFAPLELPGVGRVSLVDVPGHAQFIPTMLSGCGGLDGALFTVAADEGPMPQTAEHLDILSLLGLERGVIALTRADLASPAARAEAEARTRALTAGTFLEGAPRIFVSAVTGEGLEALRAALAAMARQAPPPPEGSPRLHVDRVFSVDGSGTVVTGTLTGGPLRRVSSFWAASCNASYDAVGALQESPHTSGLGCCLIPLLPAKRCYRGMVACLLSIEASYLCAVGVPVVTATD